MQRLFRGMMLILPILLCNLCWGQESALIVHDGTSGLEARVMSNLSTKLTAASYSVTSNVGVPGGSLAGYRQVWDIRYDNTTPLTSSDITAYVAYLAGGGSLFVMGENTGFMTRNNSIISLIQTAGGGTITVANPNNNTQTVQSPFTGPNTISSVTFLAAAATQDPANGSYATMDAGNYGAAIVYPPGSMASAPAGTLMVVFDVNFLDVGADVNLQAFSNNMIAYLADPPPPANIPTLSEWGLILMAVGIVVIAVYRFRGFRSMGANA